jgi:GntR family transcriptional regulator
MLTSINRSPVYQQVINLLSDLLRGEDYPVGSRFLSERDVAERFGVSRPTANKVLAAMSADGRLEHRTGLGYFVASTALGLDLRQLVSFTEQATQAGMVPSTDLLTFALQPAGERDEVPRELLGHDGTESIFYFERVRRANSVPVILERRWLRARFCPNLSAVHVKGSLYAALTDDFGLEIAGANETITAINLGPSESHTLHSPADSAAMFVVATGFVRYQNEVLPLWYEETVYRGDAYAFQNRIETSSRGRHSQSARPSAVGVLTPTFVSTT